MKMIFLYSAESTNNIISKRCRTKPEPVTHTEYFSCISNRYWASRSYNRNYIWSLSSVSYRSFSITRNIL